MTIAIISRRLAGIYFNNGGKLIRNCSLIQFQAPVRVTSLICGETAIISQRTMPNSGALQKRKNLEDERVMDIIDEINAWINEF